MRARRRPLIRPARISRGGPVVCRRRPEGCKTRVRYRTFLRVVRIVLFLPTGLLADAFSNLLTRGEATPRGLQTRDFASATVPVRLEPPYRWGLEAHASRDHTLAGPLWEGCHECRRCSRDTYPETYISPNTLQYTKTQPRVRASQNLRSCQLISTTLRRYQDVCKILRRYQDVCKGAGFPSRVNGAETEVDHFSRCWRFIDRKKTAKYQIASAKSGAEPAKLWTCKQHHANRGYRVLPTETKVESGMSQSKSGTSFNLSDNG